MGSLASREERPMPSETINPQPNTAHSPGVASDTTTPPAWVLVHILDLSSAGWPGLREMRRMSLGNESSSQVQPPRRGDEQRQSL